MEATNEKAGQAPAVVQVTQRAADRVRTGHPWVFSNEVRMDAEAKAHAPGAPVRLADEAGHVLGVASFNSHSLIAARLFARGAEARIDRALLAARLERALELRGRFFAAPFYRLVHSEGDGLPGLVVERFAEALVVQPNTAGAELLLDDLLVALDELLSPRLIVVRADSPARELDGLGPYVRVAKGPLERPVEVEEGGVRFLADLESGQKTGWFFDQRPMRDVVGSLSRGARVLDLYCHSGGFALRAAAGGADSVLAIDSSEPALALARDSAARNGLAGRCTFTREEAFAALARLRAEKARFGLVVADPPAFVKTRKKLYSGLRGYFKLAREAAALVKPRGLLAISSCSHHVSAEAFAEQVRNALAAAGRAGRILLARGAGPDHPVHLHLPETAYLKSLLVQLD
ncbi:MAG: class I SAM-dependent rRNA methyltransferase [Proteobacteria bacterium]|nr:class I SAM-dependent rRNA methyltransferase [Pseudomonadota bacterium]